MILSAQTIRARCGAPDPKRLSERGYHAPHLLGRAPLLDPFQERGVFEGRSFGLSSHGYDVRIAEDVEMMRGDFTLASTIERFAMPHDVCGFVKDKSSWARLGLTVQNTVIEAGWRGFLTLELTMHSRGHLVIPRGTPIAQIVFQLLDEETEQPYPEEGKYQDQEAGPQPARFERG